MSLRFFAAALVLTGLPFAAACSATDPVGSDADADAGVTSSSSSGNPASSSGGSSGGSSSGQADSGPGDAGLDGSPANLPIDPIVVGNTWTYDVTELGNYPLCPSGEHTSSVTGSRALDGKTALTVVSLCEDLGPYDYAVEGDRVFTHDPILEEWNLSLDSPVEQDHGWTVAGLDYTWQSRGAVTVPAGTFTDCWSAEQDADYDSYTVFCRGVGPVHWHYEDGFGNGYDAVLTATSP